MLISKHIFKKVKNVLVEKPNASFFIFSFIVYVLITLIIFNHRLPNIFTSYAMPDVDTDGGMWYQWFMVYTKNNGLMPEITTLLVYPFGYDLTFVPFSNLIYSAHIFILNLLGFSWQKLIFITNFSSLITYPVSALGAAALCFYLTKNKAASFISGLIFGFSFYHIFMGRGQMSINHTEFIPFYFLSLFYFLDKKTLSSLVASSLIFSIMFKADAYYAFFSGIFSLIIVILYKNEKITDKFKTFFKYYVVLFIVLFLMNFNFVLSNLYLFEGGQRVLSGRNSIPRNELIDILYFFSPTSGSLLYYFLGKFSFFVFILPMGLVIASLTFVKKNRVLVISLLCFLLGIVLSAYIPSLYWINELYFKYFPMFRGVGRIILPTYLFFGLMAGIVIAEIGRRKLFIKINKKISYFAFVAFCLIVILSGLNVDETWTRSTDFSKIAMLYEPIKNNKEIKVIATYPMTVGEVAVGCPQTYQLTGQIIHNKNFACGASPFSNVAIEYYKKISNINNENTIDVLTKYGVDTIILSNKLLNDSGKINSKLKNDERLIFVGRYTASRDNGYLSTQDLSRDISVYQIKNVVENNKQEKALIYVGENNKLSYRKISPYKYILSINLQRKTDLVFNSPYSDKWQIFIGDLSGFNDLTFLNRKPVFLDHHVRFNEYANSWQLDPVYIKNNLPNDSFRLNKDGSVDLLLTIYFKPKALIYLGELFSYITFGFCLFILIWVRVKNKIYLKRTKTSIYDKKITF